MNTYHKFLIITVLWFIFFGCKKEEIEISRFTVGATLPEIIVEGGVLSVPGKQFVRLSEPQSIADVGKYDTITPISDAQITLFDGEKYYHYKESKIAGEYLTIDSIQLSAGKEYTLSIDVKGKKYFAKDTMKPCDFAGVLPVNEVTYDETGRVYFKSHIHTFGFYENSMWILNHYYNPGTATPVEYLSPKTLMLTNTSFIFTHNSVLLRGVTGGTGSTLGAGEPDQIEEFVKFSLSNNYYKYLISVFNLTVWTSGIFSTIPGNTKTNISEGGAGYFFAADVKKIRVKFKDIKPIN